MKAASLRVDELTAQVAAMDLDIREKEDDIKGLQVWLPGVVMGGVISWVFSKCCRAVCRSMYCDLQTGGDLCLPSWTADLFLQARS